MRILVVTQYFWPENFRINDLVGEFSARGHEVTVLTGIPNYPSGKVFEEFARSPTSFARYGAIAVERVPMFARGTGTLRLMLNYLSFAVSASLAGGWRLRGKPYDVIFVFEPSPITVGLPAVLLRHLKGAPLAFWVLDLWPETLQAIGVVKAPGLLKAVGRLVSFIYKRCDLILAQSRSFVPQILRYCTPGTRVEYFPSWSDAEFDSDAVEPAPEVPPAGDIFSVLFAGNIGEAQDFPTIIEAVEATRGMRIRWLIVGDGRAAAWAREEVRRRGLDDIVLFFGQYPVERMPSFFKHADALLVSLKDTPIFAMTIPGKLQSYLAAGIPVLAMLDGEGAEIVETAGAGFSSPAGHGRALADNALRLAAMPEEERDRMGARGRAFYRENFDRDMLISRLLAWFKEMRGAAGTAR